MLNLNYALICDQKGGSSKALLDLEANPENKSSSSLDLKLCVDKRKEFLKPRTEKGKGKGKLSDKKPEIMPVPESQVLGKLKDFLGVIAESNKQLENNAKEDSGKYDIEVLTGKESEYIELDLMLGVADLHTPEAVAVAESAIADYQHPISLDASSTDDDNDDDCSDEEKDENETALSIGNGYSSRKTSTKKGSKKRKKIVEIS